jgi:hypothetical protein
MVRMRRQRQALGRAVSAPCSFHPKDKRVDTIRLGSSRVRRSLRMFGAACGRRNLARSVQRPTTLEPGAANFSQSLSILRTKIDRSPADSPICSNTWASSRTDDGAITMDAFAGIDVAFAKGKRLPVCVCLRQGTPITPLLLVAARDLRPPTGRGNIGTLDPDVLVQFAGDVADYLHHIEQRFGVTIQRIGIDAPSDPRRADIPRRQAESHWICAASVALPHPAHPISIESGRRPVPTWLAAARSRVCRTLTNCGCWLASRFSSACAASTRRRWGRCRTVRVLPNPNFAFRPVDPCELTFGGSGAIGDGSSQRRGERTLDVLPALSHQP